MLITVVIPVYNEEHTIGDILKQVDSIKLPFNKEIVVVNDCSTDDTRKVIEGHLK